MLGVGLKVIWKALATQLINTHVGQIKLMSESTAVRIHTSLSPDPLPVAPQAPHGPAAWPEGLSVETQGKVLIS